GVAPWSPDREFVVYPLDENNLTLFYNSVRQSHEGQTMLELSTEATRLAGILVLAAVTVESGGLLLVRIAAGGIPTTEFQEAFARAGHGHAGTFIALGLVTVLLTDATMMDGLAAMVAR